MVVTRDIISSRISNETSTCSPTNSTPVTAPTGTPAIRTCAPSLSPAILGKIAFSGYRCHENPPDPLTAKMSTAAMMMAAIDNRPTLSSAQASDFVRGMVDSSVPLRQERLQVRVLGRGGAKLRGVSLEMNAAVLQHDELRLLALLGVGRHDLDVLSIANRLVRRDPECVAQLVRHDDGAHVLEIAQLHDLVVHGVGSDRVEPGGRLVVEQDARLGG